MTMTTEMNTESTQTAVAPTTTALAKPSAEMTVARGPMQMIGSEAYKTQLEPTNFKEAWQICQSFARMDFCGVKSPDDALSRVLYGRELGMGAVQSMRSLYVVYGRPCMEANAMLALCKQSPLCEKFGPVMSECDDKKATYIAKRRGEDEVKFVFTIEEAKAAELVKPGSNWVKWPRQMLRARCISNLANLLFPDVIRGLQTKEDVEDLRGEVTTAPAEHVVTVEMKPVAGAQVRDFEAETAALLARLEQPMTRKEASQFRKDVTAWDVSEMTKQPVLEAYEKKMKEAPKQEAE